MKTKQKYGYNSCFPRCGAILYCLRQIKVIIFLLLPFMTMFSLNVYCQQQLSFKKYGNEQLLPYSKLNDIYVDQNHFLWLPTVRGLFQYNGTNFIEINVGKNEKVGNIISFNNIIEDNKGNVFVGCSIGIYFKLNGHHAFNIHPKIGRKGTNCQVLTIDKHNYLWYVVNDSENTLHKVSLDTGEDTTIGKDIIIAKTIVTNKDNTVVGLWFTKSTGAWYMPIINENKGGQVEKYYDSEDKTSTFDVRIEGKIIVLDTSRVLLPTIAGLILVNRTTKKHTIFDFKLSNTMIDDISMSPSGLIYCTVNSVGVVIFDLKKEKVVNVLRHHDSDPRSIASDDVGKIYIDRSNNLFISCEGDGISHCSLGDQRYQFFRPTFLPNAELQSFLPTSNTKHCIAFDNKIYFTVDQGNIAICDYDFQVSKVFDHNLTHSIKCLFKANEDSLFAATDKGIFLFTKGKYEKIQVKSNLKGLHFKYINQLIDGRFLAASEAGLFISSLQNGKLIFNEISVSPKIGNQRYDKYVEVDENHLLLQFVNSELLYCKKDINTFSVLSKYPFNGVQINSFTKINNHQILMATSAGIMMFDAETKKISIEKILKGQNILSLIANADTIIALTNRSITKMLHQNAQLKILNETTTRFVRNISSTYINHNGQYILGTYNGFMKYDPKIGNETEIKYFFNDLDLKLSEENIWQKWNYSDHINIALTDQKSFTVSIPDYIYDADNIYYNLSGNENDWKFVKNGGVISFDNLSHGKYDIYFNIEPKFNDAQHKYIYFEKRLWQNLWLQLLLASIILYFIISFSRQQQKRKIEVAELNAENVQKQLDIELFQKKINEVKLEVLRAQMNPHFIFNSLNSIDNFIIKNDKRAASEYLNTFSKLIRNTLDSSRNELIPFTKDFETIKWYVELEQMRFRHIFAFEIKIDERILNSNTMVPPMLVQPFIENAILHGLVPCDRTDLTLVFEAIMTDEAIIYIITDNGIGRKKSQSYKNLNMRKSEGINITTQRLKIHNGSLYQPSDMSIYDLEEGGIATGTRVEIKIYYNAQFKTES